MIIVRLMGGHSNQLFQYATGYRLALKHKTTLKLDLSWFDRDFQKYGETKRVYELSCYPINAEIATKKDLSLIDTSSHKKSFRPSLLRKQSAIHELLEGGPSFNKRIVDAPDNTYLVGNWQSEKYFKNIRNSLLVEFEPKTKLTSINRIYFEDIQSSLSVSIHIRREDYVYNDIASEFHGIIPLSYYIDGIKLLEKKFHSKEFKIFVFSKDIKWCKNNLKFNHPTVFIEGNKNGADDMRLMKNCKHNILANSSFSWWAAWLNQNPSKIVIAPKKWFNDPNFPATDLIPKKWIRI